MSGQTKVNQVKVLSEEEVGILTSALKVYADAWEEDEARLALILEVLGKVHYFYAWTAFSQVVVIGRADKYYPPVQE